MNEFRRMMQRVLKNKLAEQITPALLVLLMIGLLFSRALLSFASVAMIIPFILNYPGLTKTKWPLTAIALILLPVIVSGCWSADKQVWINSVLVKVPLLTILLGLSASKLTQRTWQKLVWVYLVIIATGCCWSLFQYLGDRHAIQESYLRAKVMPTPADQDYIRFSWMVGIGVFLGLKCLFLTRDKKMRALIASFIIFLVIYLHVLASKTGLLSLYSGCCIYLFYIIIIQKKWKLGAGLVLTLIISVILAYTNLPTLHNRVQYVVYDFNNYSRGNYIPGYNDAARWLSIKAGYAITQQNPFTGVGFGDLPVAVNQWHQKTHPDSYDYERFLPANEWLVYGAGSGWPGLLVFTAGIFFLFYLTTAKDPLSVILSATACIPFLTDDSLEGQYGVILLAFIAFFGQQKFSKQYLPV